MCTCCLNAAMVDCIDCVVPANTATVPPWHAHVRGNRPLPTPLQCHHAYVSGNRQLPTQLQCHHALVSGNCSLPTQITMPPPSRTWQSPSANTVNSATTLTYVAIAFANTVHIATTLAYVANANCQHCIGQARHSITTINYVPVSLRLIAARTKLDFV